MRQNLKRLKEEEGEEKEVKKSKVDSEEGPSLKKRLHGLVKRKSEKNASSSDKQCTTVDNETLTSKRDKESLNTTSSSSLALLSCYSDDSSSD